MQVNDTDLAYWAGFFDGEGSITIHENCKPSPRSKSPNHTLQVSIGNTDPRVLRRIQAVFGGGLSCRRGTSAAHRNLCQWCVRAAAALPFLEAIRPFLQMKADQADVAIAFQKSKVMQGPKLIGPDVIAWREAQRKKIRRLNARSWISIDQCGTRRQVA